MPNPKNNKNVLILGCGYVGSIAALIWLRLGYRVTVVRRSWQRQDQQCFLSHNLFPSYTEWDLTDSYPAAIRKTAWDSVLYSASPGRTEAGYKAIYQQGIERALDELKTRLFILTSSTSVFGERGGAFIFDKDEVSPNSFRSEYIVSAEKLLIKAAKGTNKSAQIARLSGIYGPGRDRLLRHIASGDAEIVKGQRWYTNRIHRDDAARALVFMSRLSSLRQEGKVKASSGVASVGDSVFYSVSDNSWPTKNELRYFLSSKLSVDYQLRESTAANGGEKNKRVVAGSLLDAGFVWKYEGYQSGYAEIINSKYNGA